MSNCAQFSIVVIQVSQSLQNFNLIFITRIQLTSWQLCLTFQITAMILNSENIKLIKNVCSSDTICKNLGKY